MFKRNLSALALLALSLLAAGCSGSGGSSTPPPPPPTITVAISPGNRNLQTGATLQFSATVSGTSNTAVTWQAGGVTGGNGTVGKISASGLYTAPAAVPDPKTVAITAISQQDSTASASITLTIVPPPITISISPSSASVETLYTQQFALTITGSDSSAVTWQVNGVAGGDATTGTVSAAGLYTAPQTVPSPATITVSAVSTVDPSKLASASVTVTPPPAPKGTWAFVGPEGSSNARNVITPDVQDSNVLYAAAGIRGIYKSINQGSTWKIILDDLGAASVYAGRNNIYVESGIYVPTGGFYVSGDGGSNFSTVPFPAEMTAQTPPEFTLDPNNDSTLYLFADNWIFKSTDGGSTWSHIAIPSSVPPRTRPAFAVSETNSASLYLGVPSGFTVSNDGGLTWKLQNKGLDPDFMAVRQVVQNPLNAQHILITAGYSGTGAPTPATEMYESLDQGKTWASLGFGDLVSPQTGSPVWSFCYELCESSDSGATWKETADPKDPHARYAAEIPASPSVLFYSGELDLHRTTDGGASWSVAQSGIQARSIQQVLIAGSTMYAKDADGGLWSSTTFGQPWKHLVSAYTTIPIPGIPNPLVSLDRIAIDPANSSHIIGLSIGENVTFVSEDGGRSWKYFPTQPKGFTYSLQFGAPAANSLYACGTYGVAVLDIKAQAWSTVNSGLGNSPACTSIAADQNNPGTLYASVSGRGIYKSTDGGGNWAAQSGTAGANYTSISINPQDSNVVYAGSAEGVITSNDAGRTWTPLHANGDVVIDPKNTTTIYTTFRDVSYDSGLTWATLPTAPKFIPTDLAIAPASGALFFSSADKGVVTFQPK